MNSRRALFSKLGRTLSTTKREPFFAHAPYFAKKENFGCEQCPQLPCTLVCPENILFIKEGLPFIDVNKRGCTFCKECAQACPYEVLSLDNAATIEAHIKLDIVGCLAWNGTICRTCSDVCIDGAIQFLGLFNPEINPNKCTACGFCIGVCPSQTIIMEPKV